MLPKSDASAYLIFPEPRLRFMNAERDRAAQRGAEVLGIQALIVDAVARFVKDAEEGFVEVARIVARGEPAIAGADAAAEGMDGRIESAGREVEADRRRRCLAEQELTIHRKFALQNVSFRLAAASR